MPSTPAYLRIAADLRAQIDRGELAAGNKLPTESALMESYAVSRTVAKNAIIVLKTEGLVEGRQGSGVYVRAVRRMTPIGADDHVDPPSPSRQVADELREQIRQGRYRLGEKLPSERKLADEYNIARNTATTALSILQKEGLLDRRHGSGWYVREPRPLLRLGFNRYSHALREQTSLSPFRAEVAKQGRTARVDCTSITRSQPPNEIAERLDVDPDSESVIRRENWYFADDELVQAGVTYIPLNVAGDSVLAHSANMGKGSLYARFKDQGHTLTRIREEISSRMPTPEEQSRLAIPEGVPVIVVLHTGFDQKNKAFEVTEFVMRTDTNALDYNLPIED